MEPAGAAARPSKRVWFHLLVLTAMAGCAARAQTPADFRTPQPLKPGDTLVIGFLGSWERWDDPDRGVRKTALRLREMGLPGVFAETVENHHREGALALITQAFDFDGDGRLDAREAAQSRVVLYGQSLGGSAAVWTAKRLARLGVPVLLTVQIDSVGIGDEVIPANVAQAANLYQREPLTIRGFNRIRAADPSRTRILCNQRYRYFMLLPARTPPESWARRNLGGGHARMEADPAVWSHVLALITGALRS
ncbi:MAG: hypothetical protein ACKV22_13540 [Bryobacteraceae bacterium]